jgi:hypothetical protein
VGLGQAQGVLLETLDAEDLGADRLLLRGGTVDDRGALHLVLRSAPFKVMAG